MMEQREEPILVEQISGTEIIDDLAARLVEGLAGNCYLTANDAYASYSAKMVVEIQLIDVNTPTVSKTLVVGELDPSTPTHQVTIDVPPTTANEVRERSGTLPPSLERMVDGSELSSAATVEKRRYYTPRTRKPAA